MKQHKKPCQPRMHRNKINTHATVGIFISVSNGMVKGTGVPIENNLASASEKLSKYVNSVAQGNCH